MVGDSIWDVEAAKRAGIPTVGVISGATPSPSCGRPARPRSFESVADLRERPELLEAGMSGSGSD